ncbi:MAG TPA: alpha-glucan family phosphorylase [Solirubrobacteraceae bacterium]|nr:alpha-glucan family phosphorylase [Solirubrobacteraceae bacterium]
MVLAPGNEDLARRAADLARRLPDALAPLARIAYNYRWAWYPDGKGVFRTIDDRRWELCGENPVRLLQEVSSEALDRAAADPDLLARVALLENTFTADFRRPAVGPVAPERPIAFFCAEYGVHQSLPIYSGGLGALAGDVLKEASDRALPMVAVGLLYRQGYFRQRLEASGWQQEYWTDIDPERLPAALVRGPDGQPLTITVPIRGTEVTAQIWRVAVGRVPLLLLDTDRPENGRLERWITSQLYVADPITRLSQYALLGVGGVRALAAVGIDPALVHLNEGHAGFAALEMARAEAARGASAEAALEAARQRTVFTTHTPVAAGNETYSREDVISTLGAVIAELGVDPEEIVGLGRNRTGDYGEPFGVTQFSLRMSRAANGVSRRHASVAREMWRGLWPHRPVDAVPITHVTNGVHLASWIGPPMRRLLDRHLGEDWWRRADDEGTWAALDAVPDAELWSARREQRTELVEFVKQRSGIDRLAERQPRPEIEAAARAFDPDVLTIGFARRNATYKRIRLLIQNPGRALRLLAGPYRIQLVLAGKAHPSDNDAKRVVQELYRFKDLPDVTEHVVFLHDYDLGTAARLVRGCDLWLNLPRPPLEASGTSGMKVVINGGLHLSVLDGWWAEAYDGTNGWALSGDVDPDPGGQDARDAGSLYDLFEQQVGPSFYNRDADGLPRSWLTRIRASIRTLAPAFCTGRMLDDYVERVYRPTTTSIGSPEPTSS